MSRDFIGNFTSKGYQKPLSCHARGGEGCEEMTPNVTWGWGWGWGVV